MMLPLMNERLSFSDVDFALTLYMKNLDGQYARVERERAECRKEKIKIIFTVFVIIWRGNRTDELPSR